MYLVDANVLLYAVNTDAVHHERARDWLEDALSGEATVLLPWVSLLAFLRLSTHARVHARPLPTDDALEILDGWLASPVVVTPEPDSRHGLRLRELLDATGAGGNLVNDAHLAALALQWRATVVTFDNDFGRFPGVTWESPRAT